MNFVETNANKNKVLIWMFGLPNMKMKQKSPKLLPWERYYPPAKNFLICRPLGVHRDRAGRGPRADAGAGQSPRVDGAQDGQGRPGEL